MPNGKKPTKRNRSIVETGGKIKIIYMIGALSVGGAERQLVELVKGLDPETFTPVVYTMGAEDENALASELQSKGIRVKALCINPKGRRLYHPRAIVRMATVPFRFRRERAQIFHGYLFWAYTIGSLSAALARIPLIVTSRRSLHTSKTPRKSRLYAIPEFIVNHIADAVVANSKAVLEDTIHIEGIDRDKIVCIYNGVYQASEVCSEDELMTFRSKWKRPPDELLLGVVANLIHYKGHEYLFRAVSIIKKKTDTPFRFVLIGGNGNRRQVLESLAAELNIADDIVFAGTIPQAQRLMAAFDISVLPSLEEGFSNTVLESMASGVPVIATDVGGNAEAVVDGKTGFLAPPADPGALAERIALLLEDAPLRRRIGDAGRKHVTGQFSIENMVERTEALYRRLIEARA